jgi:DNA-binding IscR family transcriptional regulator
MPRLNRQPQADRQLQLRILILLAQRSQAPLAISSAAGALAVNSSQIHSAIGDLLRAAYIKLTWGTPGGLQLARPAHAICMLEVLSDMDALHTPPCIDEVPGIESALDQILAKARRRFDQELRRYSLADVAGNTLYRA